MKSNSNPRITPRWRFTGGKLSPAWRRLIQILSESREGKPMGAGEERRRNGETKKDEPK